jgi:hypothetical protein
MWKAALQLMVLANVAGGQQVSGSGVKVLTACELLGDMNSYADSAVAVVGQLERSVSLIDHYEYLRQDGCEHPVVTHGHKWSNKIQIWTDWEEGMPKPPSNSPKLDQGIVAAKLSAVQKTTRLGSHQEPRFKTEGKSTTTVPNEWAVVYGRIVRSPRLDEDCGRRGCGGDDVPLIIVAKDEQVHTLGRNAAPK